ncbi:MAG: glycoside hydrolase N-terminal domain-containing protein, partial [Acidobacteria bacterium]|nr:glycoside hydrolase N-terminal domain-containing protein [Acidobacteriota bacterium]
MRLAGDSKISPGTRRTRHPARRFISALAALPLLLLLLPAVVTGRAIPARMPGERHGLRFATPANVWDEALPLGNGIMGALVWGDGRPVRISLDRADLWDLQPVPEFSSPEYRFRIMREWHLQGRTADLIRLYEAPYRRPAPTKIPAGRIELTLAGAEFLDTSLTLADATAFMRFKDGTQLRAIVHAGSTVGMVSVRTRNPIAAELLAPPFAGRVDDPARGSIDTGDLAQLGYPPPERSAGPSFRAFAQQGYGGFRFAVYLGWRQRDRSWQAAWSIASSFEGSEPLKIARGRVEAALAAGFDAMARSHARWWRDYWRKSSVRLPNPILERQWFLETYKFGSAARRGAPPISLQAVWTADNGKLPPWKGDYHHDLNTQLSYWPCYAGNHLEGGLGYLDYLWNTREAASAWTKRFFELPGLNVPMTADLNGNQIGGWRQYTHSATTAAWLAQHFYLHWKYSADRAFLKERAYPYLKDAAVFLEAFTAARGPDGVRTFPLSASPEINDNRPEAWFLTPTNYDLALSRWLFAAAAELAGELGLPDDSQRWQRVLSELPPLALGEDGRLLVAQAYPLPASHRHFSHLMAIHPLGLLDL